MKCIVLAAGYATRLYPLTENFPKALLDINGKSILDYLVDDINNIDLVDEFIIISNHKFIEFFNEWKNNKNINKKITILDDGTTCNDNRLGAVVDIEFAIEKLNIKDDLLVVAGDNILDFSLNEFVNYFENKKSTCIMRYYTNDENRLKKSANILVDSNDKVMYMKEKPQNPVSNWCCPAFYIYEKNDVCKVKEALKDNCEVDAPGSFMCWLYNKSNVHAYEMPGERYDIGTFETYEKVKTMYKNR